MQSRKRHTSESPSPYRWNSPTTYELMVVFDAAEYTVDVYENHYGVDVVFCRNGNFPRILAAP